MTRQLTKSGDSVIVYDDARVSQISPKLFDPEHWQNAERTAGKSGGRGAAVYINAEGQDWVLRHYYRGGLPGKFLDDQFIWTGESRTRCIREWELLQLMHDLGLPVPAPVAARYVRRGLCYTADLITQRLPDVMPFSRRLESAAVPAALWQRAGECIARFHFAGFYHADLNAHNLQVDVADNIFLLDWDRGDRRPPGSWRNSNLARLHRSLRKVSRNGAVHFEPPDWEALMQAYLYRWHRLPD